MIDISVSIELCGSQIKVGSIVGETNDTACFSYSKDYLESKENHSISISLPLREEPFSPEETRGFFEALLPEGYTRKTVAGWLRVDEGDYLGILRELGRECIGAIRLKDSSAQDEDMPAYKKLTQEQLKELAREGIQGSAKLLTGSRVSLAGASGKTGLFYDESKGDWYIPLGDAPSTHIVKQSHIRLSSIVTNEKLSMMAAELLGIHTPESFILDTGSGEEEDVLFATKRFDRLFAENPKVIDGLPVPYRLHQEDFGQALKIKSEHKYETGGGLYLKKMFDLLRVYSTNPVEDTLKLWDMVIFNYLIGNTDGHVKNFGLLYNEDLSQVRLAPAYDIISTVIYEESTRDMAFGIDGIYDIGSITKKSFENEADRCGIGVKMAMRRFDEMSADFEGALVKAAEQLKAQGFGKAVEICGKILKERKK